MYELQEPELISVGKGINSIFLPSAGHAKEAREEMNKNTAKVFSEIHDLCTFEAVFYACPLPPVTPKL